MAHPTLATEARDMTLPAKKLRKLKKVPAVYYGRDKETEHMAIDHEAFRKVFKAAGSNTIVDLKLPSGKTEKVLIHVIQKHPVTDLFIHVDFYGLQMKEKLNTEVPFNFTGEAGAVKNFGGILVTNRTDVEVRCLPTDLIHEIDIDLSTLENIGDSIHISDLKLPSTLEIVTELEEMIVTVQGVQEEEEVDETAEMVMPEATNQAADAPEAEAEKE